MRGSGGGRGRKMGVEGSAEKSRGTEEEEDRFLDAGDFANFLPLAFGRGRRGRSGGGGKLGEGRRRRGAD